MANRQDRLNKKRKKEKINKINKMNNRTGKRARNNNVLNKIIITTIFFLVLLFISIYIVDKYIKIQLNTSGYSAEKLNSNESTIVETVDNNSVTKEETIDNLEEATKSVVGISKLQTSSSSILSTTTEDNLGLRNRCYCVK